MIVEYSRQKYSHCTPKGLLASQETKTMIVNFLIFFSSSSPFFSLNSFVSSLSFLLNHNIPGYFKYRNMSNIFQITTYASVPALNSEELDSYDEYSLPNV